MSGIRLMAIAAPLLALAGCTAAPAAGDAESEAVSPSRSPSPLVLAIAGDVHFSGRTAALLQDPADAFGPISEVLSAADHAVVNLETAVTTGGVPEPKQWLFRTDPRAYEAVTAAGVDLVSLANNHALDYGESGLIDTLDHAEAADMPVVGAGVDTTAAVEPHYVTISDTTVAYLAMSQVWELADSWAAGTDRPGIAHTAHKDQFLDAVERADDTADVVVVLPHWGTEGQECPNAEQLGWARRLTEAGADAIIGTHAHLLQGMGYIDDTFVAYGTGNFVWWRDDAYSNDTGVIELTIENKKLAAARLAPAVIDDSGRPIPATEDDAKRIDAEVEQVRECAELAPQPR